MRKLATIRRISNLVPIPNCQNIELAVIDGWQVIVKKTEFEEGDLCVFFEIDSFLPIDERYSFLKESTYLGKQGYRLKTMKLRGALSQGLALPLKMFNGLEQDYSIGDDLTKALGVIKYDVAELTGKSTPGQSKSTFPKFLPKTDQERIQNLTTYFKTKTYDTFEETLKLDGSSMTCYKIAYTPTLWERLKAMFNIPYLNSTFGVCSRNQELKRSETSDFWKAAISHNIEAKLPIGYAVQGELIGPRIQANHEKVQELAYYVFDVYSIKEQRYLLPAERQQFCKEKKINHVPITNVEAQPLVDTLDNLLKHVEGQSINPGTISEGRVYKHNSQPETTFKAISNKYLLKSEK